MPSCSSLIRLLACGALGFVLATPDQALAKPQASAPGEPSGLRKEVAYALLSYIYKNTAAGRPEISATAQMSGNTFRLTVRLPLRANDGTGSIRCSAIASEAADAEGKFHFSMQIPKPDNSCGSGEKLVPFKELEGMLGRIQACRQKDEGRCLVSAPGSNPRLIFMLK